MAEGALRFHTTEFLADTFWLTTEEVGAYARLLFYHAFNGRLPNTPDEWSGATGLSIRRVRKSLSILQALFEVDRDDGTSPAHRALHGTRRHRPAIPSGVKHTVFERDGFVCVYCECHEGPFDLDHKIPWSRGGKHTVDNLVVACQRCNRSKGALTTEEWMGAT